jgi:serine/threonine-protein kinase HipA
MNNKCLFCYEPLEPHLAFHEKCSRQFFGTPDPPTIPYSLSQMKELARQVVERSISVPGVQPKLSMSALKESKQKAGTRLTVVGALGGQYIFKPPSEKYLEMPENEHLTMRIAESFGIRTAASSLIRLASGELSFITKRMDRTPKGEKIHMLDMFQITEAFDKYKGSMEKLGHAIGSYSDNPLLDKVFYFELVLFCYLTGNNDMHLKNISLIEGPSGWVLAPAYDLLNVSIINPADNEELALSLAGKKRKLNHIDFEKFGDTLGLTARQIQGAFDRMIKNKTRAMEWIGKSFLSEKMKEKYKNILVSRYIQLGFESG